MSIREKSGLTMIDIIVVLSGLALLLLMGYFSNPTIRTLLEAVGTSLIAAGFVTYLIRRFYQQEQRDTIKVAAESRNVLDKEYVQRKYSARETDIVGIALSGCLEELARDSTEKMLKRIMHDRAKVRLMFLSPLANYVSQRAIEDNVAETELRKILKESVIYCIAIYKRLRNLYQSAVDSETLDREKTGSFEIRIIDMCPHSTVYRTDDKILWGIYTSARRGLDSFVLHVPKEQYDVFDQLVSHFDKLWDKNLSGLSGENYLVRYYDPNVPTLNEKLFERILGPDWKDRYWEVELEGRNSAFKKLKFKQKTPK